MFKGEAKLLRRYNDSADFEIVNPELYLATLNSSSSKLSVEFNVDMVLGTSADRFAQESLGIGFLPVDSILVL